MTRIAVLGVIGLVGCGGPATAPAVHAKPPFVSADPAVPSWLLPDDACPADVAPAIPAKPVATPDCAADLDGCMRRCADHDASACYGAALQQQEHSAPIHLSEALFLRACALGETSGCTNRAAGIIIHDLDRPDGPACAARTFELTCARQDPWGCSMFGLVLAKGQGIAKDYDRALAVLPGACRVAEDDPACISARNIIDRIEAERRPAP